MVDIKTLTAQLREKYTEFKIEFENYQKQGPEKNVFLLAPTMTSKLTTLQSEFNDEIQKDNFEAATKRLRDIMYLIDAKFLLSALGKLRAIARDLSRILNITIDIGYQIQTKHYDELKPEHNIILTIQPGAIIEKINELDACNGVINAESEKIKVDYRRVKEEYIEYNEMIDHFIKETEKTFTTTASLAGSIIIEINSVQELLDSLLEKLTKKGY